MPDYQLEIFADGFNFLEGPRWRFNRLWVSDVKGRKVYTLNADGQRELVAEVPTRPSGIGFLSDDTPLIVSMRDCTLQRIKDGKLVQHADVSHLVGGEINDMVVDPKGNAYVGSMGYDLFGGADFKPGNLILVTPDGKSREVADDLLFPNGPVISPDGNMLVVAESWGKRLTAFDIEADGSLSGRRTFADLGDYTPDGICLDEAGGIWVAAFSNNAFIRVMDGGEITDVISTGERHAVACTLGGEDLRTLFCITFDGKMSDIGKNEGNTNNNTESGKNSRLETVRVDVAGSGSP